MRPDGIISAAVSLALTGIDHIDLLHGAVSVPVIVGIVHILVGKLDSFNHHLCRVLVAAVTVVAAIVCLRVADRYRANDVKGQLEQPLALRLEVVIHRAFEAIAAVHCVGKVLLVGDALVEGISIATLERHIAEVDKDDKALLLTGNCAYITYTTVRC